MLDDVDDGNLFDPMEEAFHDLSAQKALLLSHSKGNQLNNRTQLPMGIRCYLHQLVRRKGIGGRLSKPMLLMAIVNIGCVNDTVVAIIHSPHV